MGCTTSGGPEDLLLPGVLRVHSQTTERSDPHHSEGWPTAQVQMRFQIALSLHNRCRETTIRALGGERLSHAEQKQKTRNRTLHTLPSFLMLPFRFESRLGDSRRLSRLLSRPVPVTDSVLVPGRIKHSAIPLSFVVECSKENHWQAALSNVTRNAAAPWVPRQESRQHSSDSLTGPAEQIPPSDLRRELRHRMVGARPGKEIESSEPLP